MSLFGHNDSHSFESEVHHSTILHDNPTMLGRFTQPLLDQNKSLEIATSVDLSTKLLGIVIAVLALGLCFFFHFFATGYSSEFARRFKPHSLFQSKAGRPVWPDSTR